MSREPAVSDDIAFSRRSVAAHEAEKELKKAIKKYLEDPKHSGKLSPKLKEDAIKLFGNAADAAAATGEPESAFD